MLSGISPIAIKRKATPVFKVGHTEREQDDKCRCQGTFTLFQTKNRTWKLSEENGCSLRKAGEKKVGGVLLPWIHLTHSRPSEQENLTPWQFLPMMAPHLHPRSISSHRLAHFLLVTSVAGFQWVLTIPPVTHCKKFILISQSLKGGRGERQGKEALLDFFIRAAL